MRLYEIDALRVDEWPTDLRLKAIHRHMNQTRQQEREPRLSFFYHLVKAREPALCLELGCDKAIVAAYMAAAADGYGGHVVAIDQGEQHLPRHVLPGLFDNFHYFVKDTREAGDVVQALVDRHGPIGVVWQDSSHLYAQSVVEWDIYSAMLDKKAVWVCDDLRIVYDEDAGTPGLWGYWVERPGREKKIYSQPFRGGGVPIGVIIL